MRSIQHIARSTGVLAAAGCLGLAVMTSPAHAASGGCARNYACVWSKPHYQGKSGKLHVKPGTCYNSRSEPARSINNNTPYLLTLYAKPNCKGKSFALSWGKKWDAFPFGVMSFKAIG
ncbi:peptidase inhibitor family I36 protein [Streptomyces lydicus]|uniref:peptidase inhibitor family I36 protein n=1 Tax=Streptomyces lydicus TaxID=47763 RepID=UPI000526EBB4|nr:peptidase inhibitor family I36 protein [Streptomyces lydicus]MDC7337776.1 peptidase inhibitor family I36 protein [Streptomyces lydicus]UEG92825.1 peptidase inhibitor family I36 protein [Streptomyces lydicus]